MKAGAAVIAAVAAFAASACSKGSSDPSAVPPGGGADGGAGEPGDAPEGCSVNLQFFPGEPVSGPSATLNVQSFVVNAPGVLEYHWHVGFNGLDVNFTPSADSTQITFRAPDPGIYKVDLDVTGSPRFCAGASTTINVRASGAKTEQLRAHVVSSQASGAPPFDRVFEIAGGADVDIGPLPVEPGVAASPLVMGPSGPVAAYLRFAPNGAPDAIVEAFADNLGRTSLRLVPGLYTVLVVPSQPGSVPRRIINWSSTSPFVVVGAGAPITGSVVDPASAPIERAKVQLTIDGVPSTLATTEADGTFLLRAEPGGNQVTIEVVPPEASGLPRLSATSLALDLTKPLAIRYHPGLALRDLAGTTVLRNGAPVGDAEVTVVGSLAMAGTVTAGAAVDATGEVRLTARTNGSGVVPARRVPAAALSAVVTVAAGDIAVAALDTTAGAPASLDAPAMTSVTAAIVDPASAPLRSAVVDVVPLGALARAAVPVAHVTANASGEVTAAFAAGGRYELRFQDPVGRGAPLVVTDRTAGTMASTYQLPRALRLRGSVKMFGGTQVLANAVIQILCESCSGIERVRPIAEAVSDATGKFAVSVPDPGTH
ncbi:MAG TPA: hypothetical protein VLM79_12245 [Kofleriaceae bacterium]|nr:hypothetical protein [Kofleriaceae bacterium]